MTSDSSQLVTQILSNLQAGCRENADELLEIVYSKLRRLAAVRMQEEASGQTLQPTALVHEAYLRLVAGDEQQSWESRGHFFAAAAEAMRRILIENARRKAAAKHGGGKEFLSYVEGDAIYEAPRKDILAISEAIEKLAAVDERKANLVKLRYFAGLEEREAAEVLGISRATAARWWAYSKAWLYDSLRQDKESTGH